MEAQTWPNNVVSVKWLDDHGIKRKEYESELKERKRKHLEQVQMNEKSVPWQPCLHDACQECHGTGVKLNGQKCIHFISCPCPKCTPSFSCRVEWI